MTRTVPVFTLGDRLRKAREVADMTQGDMANTLGIGRRSVSRYEDGTQMPRRGVVMAWSMATGVPLEWLQSGQMSHPDPPGGDILGDTMRYPAGLVAA